MIVQLNAISLRNKFDYVSSFIIKCLDILFLSETNLDDTFATAQLQKQPSRGVLSKTCCENMQQIYRTTSMSKCDFNKVAK